MRTRARTARALIAAAGAVSVAGAVTAAVVLADGVRRDRVLRSARVWMLTTRRSLHFAYTKIVGVRADERRRAELEEQFAIRSAEDVAAELGNMKGAIMKAGQILSFVAEGLPPQAQAALATLHADVPPMAPSLADRVVREELGGEPDEVFLHWEPVPVAAASIGQVHKAVTRDGRIVAVKVQYPGVDRAITSDLDNAEVLYRLFSSFSLRSLGVRALVDELRDRMADELDYRIEARCQADFHARYLGHPFVHIPAVVRELSTRRVLTSEWVDGMRWEDFEASAETELRQAVAEALFRFVQGAVYGARTFNGDPHPGNYRIHPDGTVTFLDFGLVKRWTDEEVASLWPIIDPLLAGDAEATVARMVDAGFLASDHGLDPKHVYAYVSQPYRPFLVEEYEFDREFTKQALGKLLDVTGPYADVIQRLDMPPSFVILDRVVWGMSALLGRLGARNRWASILAEYRDGAPPATEMGVLERRWRDEHGDPLTV